MVAAMVRCCKPYNSKSACRNDSAIWSSSAVVICCYSVEVIVQVIVSFHCTDSTEPQDPQLTNKMALTGALANQVAIQ